MMKAVVAAMIVMLVNAASAHPSEFQEPFASAGRDHVDLRRRSDPPGELARTVGVRDGKTAATAGPAAPFSACRFGKRRLRDAIPFSCAAKWRARRPPIGPVDRMLLATSFIDCHAGTLGS
jgi:hypothetical protein